MGWGPQGEWKRTETPITFDSVLEYFKKYGSSSLRRFVTSYEEGDVILEVTEGDNHQNWHYYLGRDMKGYSYRYNISVSMS